MKNLYQIPTKRDFVEADFMRILHPEKAKFSIVQYRKGVVNMKLIIDFREFNEDMVIFDDSRNEEFSEKMKTWEMAMDGKLVKEETTGKIELEYMQDNQPLPPVKRVRLQGTVITYHNNAERVVMHTLEEWQELYFNYLQEEKLDIGY